MRNDYFLKALLEVIAIASIGDGGADRLEAIRKELLEALAQIDRLQWQIGRRKSIKSRHTDKY